MCWGSVLQKGRYGQRESLAAYESPIHTPLLREGLVYVRLVCVPVVLLSKS